ARERDVGDGTGGRCGAALRAGGRSSGQALRLRLAPRLRERRRSGDGARRRQDSDRSHGAPPSRAVTRHPEIRGASRDGCSVACGGGGAPPAPRAAVGRGARGAPPLPPSPPPSPPAPACAPVPLLPNGWGGLRGGVLP